MIAIFTKLFGFIFSESPEDKTEREDWVNSMVRIEMAIQIDGKSCPVCLHQYQSVDDALNRKVREGYNGDVVCDDCWGKYEKRKVR